MCGYRKNLTHLQTVLLFKDSRLVPRLRLEQEALRAVANDNMLSRDLLQEPSGTVRRALARPRDERCSQTSRKKTPAGPLLGLALQAPAFVRDH
jgi:hypothetical protein